ncbi:hypothetical protein C5167_028412 [Papaver somniferum]|nr:hypothetical protein C5167_028412 [Papaver somniferum]
MGVIIPDPSCADPLATILATHMDKPRVYIGCMKSGEVFSEPAHKWYEPDWWKFGDGKSAPLLANVSADEDVDEEYGVLDIAENWDASTG